MKNRVEKLFNIALVILIFSLMMTGCNIIVDSFYTNHSLLPEMPTIVAAGIEFDHKVPSVNTIDKWLYDMTIGLLKIGKRCEHVEDLEFVAKSLNQSVVEKNIEEFQKWVYIAYNTHSKTLVPIFNSLYFHTCYPIGDQGTIGIMRSILKDHYNERDRIAKENDEISRLQKIEQNEKSYQNACKKYGC